MTKFSKNLLYLRKKRGIMQVQIPDLLDIKSTTWSNYENDKSEPSIKQLILISNFFEVSLDDLLLSDMQEKDEVIGFDGVGKKHEVKAEVKHEVNENLYRYDIPESLVADHEIGHFENFREVAAAIGEIRKELRVIQQKVGINPGQATDQSPG